MRTEEVLRRRMASQFLTTRGPKMAAEVVRACGAVQAQDFAGAKWALGQRTRGLSDGEVEREFSEGRFVRLHVLRPTWHFVLAEDVRWMLALSAPHIAKVMAPYDRKLGLTPQIYRRCNDALARALEGGKQLTRAECAAAMLSARAAPAAKLRTQSLGHIMLRAEIDQVVCSGARKGKQHTYALLAERAPKPVSMSRDESLAELARRYFRMHGPATVQDFMWWSGLPASDARRARDTLSDELERGEYNGREVWYVDRTLPKSTPVAHLLPNYDEYFIGHKDRSAIQGRMKNTPLVNAGYGPMQHVVFVNGELVGGWRMVAVKDGVSAAVKTVAKLTSEQARLVEAARRRFSDYVAGTR